jgi:predicted Zn-dependent protease
MMEWLRSHPVTETRAADIRKEAGDISPRPPLLSGEEWLALKAICDKKEEPTKPNGLTLKAQQQMWLALKRCLIWSCKNSLVCL